MDRGSMSCSAATTRTRWSAGSSTTWQLQRASIAAAGYSAAWLKDRFAVGLADAAPVVIDGEQDSIGIAPDLDLHAGGRVPIGVLDQRREGTLDECLLGADADVGGCADRERDAAVGFEWRCCCARTGGRIAGRAR